MPRYKDERKTTQKKGKITMAKFIKSIITYIRLFRLFFAAIKAVEADRITMILGTEAGKINTSNSMRELIRVSRFSGISPEKLQEKTRKREIVEARQVAMYLSKRNTNESLSQIGREIGQKDHATVIHACKTVGNLLETDREFRNKWMPLIGKIN